MDKKFIIRLNPITKKNSQQIVRVKGRPMIIPSKQYRQYEKDAANYLKDQDIPQGYDMAKGYDITKGYDISNRDAPIDYPCEITCLFYMKTRRKVDLTNLLEAIDDVLVKTGIIADDNSSIIVSHDGSRVYYDKNNPRTEILIREYLEQN